jgi:hypothetical protein
MAFILQSVSLLDVIETVTSQIYLSFCSHCQEVLVTGFYVGLKFLFKRSQTLFGIPMQLWICSCFGAGLAATIPPLLLKLHWACWEDLFLLLFKSVCTPCNTYSFLNRSQFIYIFFSFHLFVYFDFLSVALSLHHVISSFFS